MAFFLAVVMLLGVLPVQAASATDAVADPLRYGRQALAREDNAGSLLFAYTQLATGIAVAAERVTVYDSAHWVSPEEFQTVLEAVISDFPEFFWIGSNYGMSWDGTRVLEFMPQYSVTGSELETAQAELETAADRLLVGLEGLSDYEIALQLHDRLTARVTYAFGPNHQTVYGALVDGQAVCNGYAAAYQYLLHRLGIPAWKVSGSGINPNTGELESHAWDIVYLDGAWYHTDPTWDDQDATGYAFYSYLNVTTAQIGTDHVMDTFFAKHAPVCTATAANYYTVNTAQVLTAFSVEATVAAMQATGGSAARFCVTGDIDAFLSDWQTNALTVAQRIGVLGAFSYNYVVLGREVLLQIMTERSVSGKLTSRGGTGEVTVELWKRGATAATYIASLAAAAGETAYTLVGIRSGDYTMRVRKAGHVTGEYSVTVGVQDVTVDVLLHLIGDVTGEGKIDADDAVYTLYHVLLPDVYPVGQTVDYNGDSQLSSDDAVYLLYYTLLPQDYPLY